jgi:hypothetical protein
MRRLPALLLVLVLAAVGCGDDGDAAEEPLDVEATCRELTDITGGGHEDDERAELLVDLAARAEDPDQKAAIEDLADALVNRGETLTPYNQAFAPCA